MPAPPPAPLDDFVSVDFVVSVDVVELVPDDFCPCANAGAAAIARATTSAIALVDVFIAVLSLLPDSALVNLARARPQLAWRRSATDLGKSCATGGASTRATLGNVTGRPSRAER